MPSFDIVSEPNTMEIENAFQQAKKEISQRYDLKGTGTDVERTQEGGFLIKADSEPHIDVARELLYQKIAKRGVPLGFFESGNAVESGVRMMKQEVKVKKGLSQEVAKKIAAFVKEMKLKVQAAIQGDAVRVTGKNKDDLQAVMHAARAADLGAPLSFTNFRD